MSTPIERLLSDLGEPITTGIFWSDAEDLAPKLLAHGMHRGHELHQDGPRLMISTQGARNHADDEHLWSIYRRFIKQDWGELRYQEDLDQNNRNANRERGILFGIYSAPDGAPLWIQQNHRYAPPTVMLPEER